jgi:hypothetical protein
MPVLTAKAVSYLLCKAEKMADMDVYKNPVIQRSLGLKEDVNLKHHTGMS